MGACDRSSELSAYHDNALPDEKRIALEGHLQSCQGCAHELECLRRLSRLFAAGGHTPEPVRVKLTDLRETQSAVRFEMGLIGMAASILIVCGGWLVGYAPPAADDRLDSVLQTADNRTADISDPVLQEFVKEYGRD